MASVVPKTLISGTPSAAYSPGRTAKNEELHRSYFSQVLRLAYLAPDITTAILDEATTRRAHRDAADRASQSPAWLAGAANRTRFRLNRPDNNHRHGASGGSYLATQGPRRFRSAPGESSTTGAPLRGSLLAGKMLIAEFRRCINARQRYSGIVARSATALWLSTAHSSVANVQTLENCASFAGTSRDERMQRNR
jgi:hypothetical protein